MLHTFDMCTHVYALLTPTLCRLFLTHIKFKLYKSNLSNLVESSVYVISYFVNVLTMLEHIHPTFFDKIIVKQMLLELLHN